MGEKLFGQVTDATGLPKEAISDELENLLKRAGLNKSDLTLDDLRAVLAEYVQEVLVHAKDDLANKPQN